MGGFLSYPDPKLSQPAALRDGVDDALREIGEWLLAAARESRAYGLAAVHIGEVAPVVVISPQLVSVPTDYLMLFNPRIVATAEETALGEESSVCLDAARVQVARPVWAEIAYMDAGGAPRTQRLEGFAARVAIHEIEQMNGIFFLERVSRLKRERALKKVKKQAG